MIETHYSFDDSEDPPPYWFPELTVEIQNVLTDPLFCHFENGSVLSIVFTGDKEMQSLNHTFRKIDKTTDVLTFPFHEKVEGYYFLGEIIISLDKALTEANHYGISLLTELYRLIIHGVSHILGYDHHNDQEENEMKKIEKQLISHIAVSEGV